MPAAHTCTSCPCCRPLWSSYHVQLVSKTCVGDDKEAHEEHFFRKRDIPLQRSSKLTGILGGHSLYEDYILLF